MRMHRFKTPLEAIQACFVPRSLPPLGIKPVEASESSPGSTLRNWAQWQGSTASQNQVLPFRWEAGSNCVSCLCQWLPTLLRGEGTVRHLAVLLQSITDGFLLFDPVFQLWRSTDAQILGFTWTHYPVVLVTLPHGLSCMQALLLTGHTSLCQPRTARQKLIYCILSCLLLATQGALLTAPGDTEKVDTTLSPPWSSIIGHFY